MHPRTRKAIHNASADTVGANMAEFAIGSISYLASKDRPNISFTRNITRFGQSSDPHWESAIPLMAGTITAHVGLFAAAVITSRKMIILDDSALSMAKLLHPLVDALGVTGTVMSGTDIASLFAEHSDYRNGIVYGPRKITNSEEYTLNLAADIGIANTWHDSRHPDGTYRRRGSTHRPNTESVK